MSLLTQITADIAAAMKAREAARLSALRMLKAALMNKEVEKNRALDATEDVQVVQAQVKQRRDAVEQFASAGRHELADKERAEIVVLESYLPAAVPEADLRAAIADAIRETGALAPKDMGKVMKAVQGRFAGRPLDGKALSDMVRTVLTPTA
jgi:uncharacterized protein YqeY